jgi:glucokinase
MDAAESRVERGPDDMIDRHVSLARAVVARSGVPWRRLQAVGIACGGPLDPAAGLIQSPPNLPGWDDFPLAAKVSSALGLPVFVDNDATACAVAEHWYGAGRSRGARHLIYLTISSGVGGGLVLDGRPYRGAVGNAGELGHLIVAYEGRGCRCGGRGCLEAYASGTSIAERAREALGSGQASVLAGRSAVTARDVVRAAADGNRLALEVWNETTTILGRAVGSLLNCFNPDLVVLGGGVTRAGAMLLDPVRRVASLQAMPPARRAADIVLAALGDEVGVVSAATVALERLTTQSLQTLSRKELPA